MKNQRIWVIHTIKCHIWAAAITPFIVSHIVNMSPEDDSSPQPHLSDHMSSCPWGRNRIICRLLSFSPFSNWYCWMGLGINGLCLCLCNAEENYGLCKWPGTGSDHDLHRCQGFWWRRHIDSGMASYSILGPIITALNWSLTQKVLIKRPVECWAILF